jgi:hypothetical protein
MHESFEIMFFPPSWNRQDFDFFILKPIEKKTLINCSENHVKNQAKIPITVVWRLSRFYWSQCRDRQKKKLE